MDGLYKIKEITFDFRNKYKYSEETEGLKRVLTFFLPYLEDYLKERKILLEINEKIKMADYYVHFAITDPKEEDFITHFGSVSFDKDQKQVIILLRTIAGPSWGNKLELMKTMIHEIFHLFIEGEENVKNSTEDFMNSFDLETRKFICRELLTIEEIEIIEEKLR